MKKESKRRGGFRGYRDWSLLLLGFCVMLLVTFGLAYYWLQLIGDDDNGAGDVATEILSKSDQLTVEATVKIIEARQAAFERLTTGTTTSAIDQLR